MKKILVSIDEDTANLLEGSVNKSETIRESIKVYKQYILPDSVDGFRVAFQMTAQNIKRLDELMGEINSKIDYIARKLDD